MKDKNRRPKIIIRDISDTYKSKARQVEESRMHGHNIMTTELPPAIAHDIVKSALENKKEAEK